MNFICIHIICWVTLVKHGIVLRWKTHKQILGETNISNGGLALHGDTIQRRVMRLKALQKGMCRRQK